MKLSTLRVSLMIYATACGVSNVSAMQPKEADQNAFYAKASSAGWVPSMASIPTARALRSSGDRIYCQHICIPSSPASCNGSCCAPSARRLELPQECKEREELIKRLQETTKKLISMMGKSEGIKIARTAVDQSSDSDTDSSSSLNSPSDDSDDLLEELKKKRK